MNETYVTLNGWVGSEVQLHDAGGSALATFRVGSTPRRRKGDDWVDGPTTWFHVKTWRRLAGHVKDSIRTGDPVIITGRLEADVWVKEDGTSSTQLVVTATSVGHDLAQGTSRFTKPVREHATRPDATDPWAAGPGDGAEDAGAVDPEVATADETADETVVEAA